MLNCRYIPSLKPGDPSPSEPKRESSFPGFGVQGYEFLSKQVGRNLIGRPRKIWNPDLFEGEGRMGSVINQNPPLQRALSCNVGVV